MTIQKENITEYKQLITVKSFDELLECNCIDYLHGELIINCVTFDLYIDSDFYTRIKEKYIEINHLFFSNCTFSNSMIVEDFNIEYSLDFSGSVFTTYIEFKNAKFGDKIKFKNVKFNGFDKSTFNVDFRGAIFKDEVDFRAATFEGNVDFRGATFENEVDFSGTTFENEVDFSDATFKKKVDFNVVTFKKQIYYFNTLFEGNVEFNYTTFNYERCIEGATFKKQVSFIDATFEGGYVFSYVTFEDNAEFRNVTFKNNVAFNNTTFKKEVKFSYVTFKDNLHLNNAIFEHQVVFNYTTFKNGVRFLSTTFKEEVYFINTPLKGEVQIVDTTFKGVVDFSGIKFEAKVKFNDTMFEKLVNFENSEFIDVVTMNNVKFESEANFMYTKFGGKVSFENCSFLDIIKFIAISPIDKTIKALPSFSFNFSNIEKLFIIDILREDDPNYNGVNLEFDGNLTFNYCFFSSNSSTLLRGIKQLNSCKVNFEHTNIHGSITMEDFESDALLLDYAIVTGNIILSDNVKFAQDESQYTCRILKHEALKVNDTINFLKYKSKEMYQFKTNLKTNPKKHMDRFILWLNEISNNHGISTKRGIWFTVGAWIGSYLLFLLISRSPLIYNGLFNENVTWTVSDDFAEMVSFLWSLDFLSPLTSWIKTVNFDHFWILKVLQVVLAAFVFIAGKIAIGYGIYQTISAFRKYGK